MVTPIDFTLPPLEASEITAMLVAAGLPDAGPDYDIYSKYIEGAYNDAIGPLSQAEYDTLLGVLQSTPPPEVLQAIKARAVSNAKDLITNMTRAELSKVAEQIAAATAEGKGPREVARHLDAVKGLDSNRVKTYDNYVKALEQSGLSDAEVASRAERMYQKLLRDRKTTIARTEMRQGTSQVQADYAKARGATLKVWQTSGDARVSPECAANEAQGVIDIDKTFTSGTAQPPQHVACRCTVSYLTNPNLRDEWQAIADKRAAATAAALAEAQ